MEWGKEIGVGGGGGVRMRGRGGEKENKSEGRNTSNRFCSFWKRLKASSDSCSLFFFSFFLLSLVQW